MGPLKVYEGSIIYESDAIAQPFTECFASACTGQLRGNQFPHQVHNGNIELSETDRQTIYDILKNMDTDTTTDPDDIHPLVVNSRADQVALLLTMIFTVSWNQRPLPSYSY